MQRVVCRHSRVRFSVRNRFFLFFSNELCFFRSFCLEFSFRVGVLGLGFTGEISRDNHGNAMGASLYIARFYNNESREVQTSKLD